MTLAHHWAGTRAPALRAAARPVVESLRELSASRRAVISVFVMTATIMQVLDTTVANVSLPYMQGSLSTTQDQINWVLTSYIIASAIMTSPVGWLSARFGRKRLYIVCTVGFTVASMLCGISQNIEQMVLFRLTQGAFGAALVPLAQAVMLDAYPTAQRAAAMAIWGMGIMLGPIMGPVLGGYLTETYSWRWVFYVNVPFGILTALGLSVFMPESRVRRDVPFAWFGFLSLSLGVGALQMMLDRGQDIGWFDSGEIWARGDPVGRRLLFLRRRQLHRQAAVHRNADLPRPQLLAGAGADVPQRAGADGDDGAADADAAEPARLSSVGERLSPRRARHRDVRGDEHRRPPARHARRTTVHALRPRVGDAGAMGDGGLERRRFRRRDRAQRGAARLRPRLRLHAAQHHRVLHPAPRTAHRSDRTVDAGAQHRRLDRHLDSHRQTGQPDAPISTARSSSASRRSTTRCACPTPRRWATTVCAASPRSTGWRRNRRR